MTWLRWSVIPVWAAAVVGAVLVGAFAGERLLVWIPVVMGALVLLTAAIQLSTQRKEGFVSRMIASLAGGFVILVVASLVLTATHPGVTLLPSLD